MYVLPISEVLKTAARLSPQLILDEVEAIRLKHRTSMYLDKLVAHTRALPAPTD